METNKLTNDEVFDRFEKLMLHRLQADIDGDGWEIAQTIMTYTLWQSGWSGDLQECKTAVFH